jgi:hypothetical protein
VCQRDGGQSGPSTAGEKRPRAGRQEPRAHLTAAGALDRAVAAPAASDAWLANICAARAERIHGHARVWASHAERELPGCRAAAHRALRGTMARLAATVACARWRLPHRTRGCPRRTELHARHSVCPCVAHRSSKWPQVPPSLHGLSQRPGCIGWLHVQRGSSRASEGSGRRRMERALEDRHRMVEQAQVDTWRTGTGRQSVTHLSNVAQAAAGVALCAAATAGGFVGAFARKVAAAAALMAFNTKRAAGAGAGAVACDVPWLAALVARARVTAGAAHA